MKRKTSTTPTKIWSFGALAPTTNAKLFFDQLFFGGRYYNTLIEIERRRREKYRQARSQAVPDLALLEAEWKKLDAELTAGIEALPKSGKKKVLTAELLALKERRKAVTVAMRVERAAFSQDASAKSVIALVDEAAQNEVKAARALTDLYWGSYLLVEKQIEQARKSKLDPRFRRFEGNGRVGVQLQGGLSLAELTSGEDTRLRLVERTSTARVKKPKAKHEVHLRIGSEGRSPIWVVLPVVLHRPLPPDAKIQWAWIKVQNIGGVRRLSLQLTLESETFRQTCQPGRGVVAVNFGWRAHEDGSRRVAYAVDDAGVEEEFCVPSAIEKSLELVHGLRSARALHFEEAKRALGAFMALHDVPDWLKEASLHLWQWRSPQKLTRIAWRLTEEFPGIRAEVIRWRAERLAGPERDLLAPAPQVFTWLGRHDLHALGFYLELWRHKNIHLWEWEAHQRARSLCRRNELFRAWSRRLADTYAEIRVEEFDLRKMAEIPSAEEESRPSAFRATRAAAAPGEFRSRLAEVGGIKITKAPAHGNTVTCFHCRHINERALTERMVCAGCGQEWDQDANNCRNQLRERPSGTEVPGGARKAEVVLETPAPTGNLKGTGSTSRDIVAAE